MTEGPFAGTPERIVQFAIIVIWVATWLFVWDGTPRREINAFFMGAIRAAD